MLKDIEQLAAQAVAVGSSAEATATINGHFVIATLIPGYRNAGAKRKPRMQWKVDGKVVAKDRLHQALAA